MSPSCPGFLLRGAQGVCEIEADLSALDVPSPTPDSTPAGCMSIWGPGSLQDSVFLSVKQECWSCPACHPGSCEGWRKPWRDVRNQLPPPSCHLLHCHERPAS